ncbi:hypothetical protein EVAR_88647_1 [Eumeta japonica]|uniref:Uncharacterized protein n=1 Tax=Eumeta variegata TaxID=151549 RepID=A0A4C1Y8Y9_EUMVA|nr:hypothetical protein EVAR_88647_1 [Eumeta japonica]
MKSSRAAAARPPLDEATRFNVTCFLSVTHSLVTHILGVTRSRWSSSPMDTRNPGDDQYFAGLSGRSRISHEEGNGMMQGDWNDGRRIGVREAESGSP